MDSEPVLQSQAHEICELRISHINVCGLRSKLLSPEFETFLCSYDIIGNSETKLSDEDVTCISFPGYEFCSKIDKISYEDQAV